jgi:CubicO group peptidase (beta-lactamase class C family)
MRYGCLLVLFLTRLFAASPALDPAKSGLDSNRLAQIPVRMKSFVDRGVAAGVVTLVARHGAVAEFDAAGYQNLETRKPMAQDTIFQIMSMTKPLTGIGIMMLMEEGKLGINDPVERRLPEFRGQMVIDNRNPDGSVVLRRPVRPITIRDLMTHTSGMLDVMPEAIKDHYQRMNLTLAEAVSIFSQQPLEFEPGTKWKYSSPGIGVLGRIIEVTSGQSYEEFMKERLFRPLEMKDSFFFPPTEKQNRIAMVYQSKDGKLIPAGDNILGGDPARLRKGARYPAPVWGLFSTAADLDAVYQMMLNGGSLQGRRYLSRASVELMTQIETGGIPNSGWVGGGGYGLTWEVIKGFPGTLLLLSPGAYGHSGAFGTQGWIDPAKDMIRIMLVQRSDGGIDELKSAFMTMAGSAIAVE